MSSAVSSTEPGGSRPVVASVVPLTPVWRLSRPFDYLVPGSLIDQVAPGVLVRASFGNRKVRAIVQDVRQEVPERPLEELGGVVVGAPLVPPPLDELYSEVARRYVAPLGKALGAAVPPRVRAKARRPGPPERGPSPEAILSYEGGRQLIDAISGGAAGTCLLMTAPGDDHPRLIAELTAASVSAGGGAALVMVPEVRYGSDVLDALVAEWPDLARLDASRTPGERSKGWIAAAEGAAVVAGGRSAVFAPCPQLRLIVVDEEHHPTYKEDRSPRYDARVVARIRARLQGAVCVFISPTPSMEIDHDARRGAIRRAAVPRGAARAARPVVELVEPDPSRVVSHELHRRIASVLEGDGRVGLLAPASGFARAVWCSSCRRSIRCGRCEAGMGTGRGERTLSCPRCGATEPLPDACPSCGQDALRSMGAGSERLEEQLASAFPRARVVRVDPGVLAEEELPDVDDADIYLATWIGTKRALRPQVSLVGVLSIDGLIRRPDFRAAERAYQAMSEMAAWAGPRSEGGHLLIQTAEPSHHAVQAVVRGDHGFFSERELALREELAYPPFSELIKVTAAGFGAAELIERAGDGARAAGGKVLGPIEVPDSPLGEGALEVLIKIADAMSIAGELAEMSASVPARSRLRIDTDPR